MAFFSVLAFTTLDFPSTPFKKRDTAFYIATTPSEFSLLKVVVGVFFENWKHVWFSSPPFFVCAKKFIQDGCCRVGPTTHVSRVQFFGKLMCVYVWSTATAQQRTSWRPLLGRAIVFFLHASTHMCLTWYTLQKKKKFALVVYFIHSQKRASTRERDSAHTRSTTTTLLPLSPLRRPTARRRRSRALSPRRADDRRCRAIFERVLKKNTTYPTVKKSVGVGNYIPTHM